MPTVLLAPTRSVPRSMPRICSMTSAASSSSARVRRAYSYSTWPASVKRTRLPSRSIRGSPSTASSSLTWYETDGWLMLSSSAAALKLSCSATARNVRSWWSVRVLSSASVSAIPDSRSTIGQVTEEGGGSKPGGTASAPLPGPRERIEALVDAGSFAELDRLEAGPGAGAVVGVGTIDTRDVAVYAMDIGALTEVAAMKVVKAQELALVSRIPLIGLQEASGGALPDGLAALAGFAEILE